VAEALGRREPEDFAARSQRPGITTKEGPRPTMQGDLSSIESNLPAVQERVFGLQEDLPCPWQQQVFLLDPEGKKPGLNTKALLGNV
jgi:hypothetical protein